jgi:hypothetical protein
MSTSQQIAKHFRDVHFGGNWTSVNLKSLLSDISWQEATTKIADTNTIATLVFHMNYYVHHVLGVFNGDPLTASDKFSFDLPPINDEASWQNLIHTALEEAELFAQQVEILPEAKLSENFTDAKYGNYYRNIHGIIEHTHYHLGQISLLKKLVKQK